MRYGAGLTQDAAKDCKDWAVGSPKIQFTNLFCRPGSRRREVQRKIVEGRSWRLTDYGIRLLRRWPRACTRSKTAARYRNISVAEHWGRPWRNDRLLHRMLFGTASSANLRSKALLLKVLRATKLILSIEWAKRRIGSADSSAFHRRT